MIFELAFKFQQTTINLVGVLADDGSQLLIEDEAGHQVAVILPTATNVIQVAPAGGTPTAVAITSP